MSDDTYDILRRAILQALGPRPTPERRRQIAADLRSLAEQQQRMAEKAEREHQHLDKPAAQRPPTRLGRTPGTFIRIGREQDPLTGIMRLRLSLGQQIWTDLGSPKRIVVQQVGEEIWIVPDNGNSGHRLTIEARLPNCVIDYAGPLARLTPGRYAATIRAGALVVGQRLG